MPKIQTQTNLSAHATDDLDQSQDRFALDAASSDYDYLSRSGPITVSVLHVTDYVRFSSLTCYIHRSPLFEHEHGLGPSGLRRIRQQPHSMALALPNTSSLSLGQPSVRRSPSNASSGASSAYLPAGATSPALEDLHRFPSESL